MTTPEEYIASVLERMPRDTPMRSQIAMELRALIDERTRERRPLADVLRQLGDPEKLAESYLAAVPLVPVPFADRALAKLMDLGIVLLPAWALCAWLRPVDATYIIYIVVAAFVACPLFMVYNIIAESSTDQTLGKRVMGTRVVREAGTRISAGQAIVRQLPWLLQVFWIDAFFALFTDRHQRAFELLSRTRVVRVPTEEMAP